MNPHYEYRDMVIMDLQVGLFINGHSIPTSLYMLKKPFLSYLNTTESSLDQIFQ